jgi:hypothetical protein
MRFNMLRTALMLICLVLVACDDAGNVVVEGNRWPVGSETDAVFDAALIGSWRTPAADTDNESLLNIRSDDLRSYLVRMREPGDQQTSEMPAYVVDVLGAKYLNGRLTDQPGLKATGWVTLRYWFQQPNRLIVAMVGEEAWASCDVNSAAAVYACLREHPPDPKVLETPATYERVSLVTTQPNNGFQRTAGAQVPGRIESTSARRR